MNGITRQKVIELSRSNGLLCREKNFSLFDCYSADEAFVTGTFGGLTPVFSIDGREIGMNAQMGEVTAQLQAAYEALIHDC